MEQSAEEADNAENIKKVGFKTEPELMGQPAEEHAYIAREHFTSEAFKIEVANVPKYFGFGECKKLLKNKLKLNPHKIKCIPNIQKVYITFKNEDDKKEALEKLNMYEYKGKVLAVKNAKPKADAMTLKRPSNSHETEGSQGRKKIKADDEREEVSPQDYLMDSVNKWHNVPYKEQLERKQVQIKEFLRTLRQRLGKFNLDNEVFVWIMKHKNISDGMCCPLHPIVPSPVERNYRNKSEFTVGVNSLGLKTVGNRLGKYREQTCTVEAPTPLVILPEKMKEIAAKFQEYVRTSGKEAYNPQNYEGHWRQLTVRTSLSGESLAIIVTCKKGGDTDEIIKEKEELRAMVESGSLAGMLSSLLYHATPTHKQSGVEDPAPEVLHGHGYITENLLGLQFRISAEAFFQCNTLAAEVLYSTISRMLQAGDSYGDETGPGEMEPAMRAGCQKYNKGLSREVILFDVCCGTGTIGLSLASHVKHVVGVELCEQAVEDAEQNAELNGIKNAEFHCGKAEDLLPTLIKKHQENPDHEIVAIVDPPRPGLHFRVIQCLRKCPILQRIIYVSCNPNSAASNFIDLCRPKSKRMPGLPFLPLFAQPFDLFPQTPHCELVVALKRTSGKAKVTQAQADAVTEKNNLSEDKLCGSVTCEESGKATTTVD